MRVHHLNLKFVPKSYMEKNLKFYQKQKDGLRLKHLLTVILDILKI